MTKTYPRHGGYCVSAKPVRSPGGPRGLSNDDWRCVTVAWMRTDSYRLGRGDQVPSYVTLLEAGSRIFHLGQW